MSLAFLEPRASSSRQLRARSPMERAACATGARLAQIEGWNVPNAYSDPSTERERLTRTVGFVDRSHLTKLELQGAPIALEWIRAAVPAVGEDGTWWCAVTPARVLLLCEPGPAAGLRAALAQARSKGPGEVCVLDVTCALSALSLVGPLARELLARFCAIDVRAAVTPVAAFRPGSVARTPGYVLAQAPERLLVLVGWAYGEYLWQVVAEAAAELGGGPVGEEALGHLLEREHA